MIDQVKLIDLPKNRRPSREFDIFEDGNQIPFKIERVFWTYDVPGGQKEEVMHITNRMSLL